MGVKEEQADGFQEGRAPSRVLEGCTHQGSHYLPRVPKGQGPLRSIRARSRQTGISSLPSSPGPFIPTLKPSRVSPHPKPWSQVERLGRASQPATQPGVDVDRALPPGVTATALHAGPLADTTRMRVRGGEGPRKTPEASVCGWEELLSSHRLL